MKFVPVLDYTRKFMICTVRSAFIHIVHSIRIEWHDYKKKRCSAINEKKMSIFVNYVSQIEIHDTWRILSAYLLFQLNVCTVCIDTKVLPFSRFIAFKRHLDAIFYSTSGVCAFFPLHSHFSYVLVGNFKRGLVWDLHGMLNSDWSTSQSVLSILLQIHRRTV